MRMVNKIGVIGFVLLFLFSCEDEVDFRDMYCGDWEFTIDNQSFHLDDGITIDTTYYHTGSIWYHREGTININYKINTTLEFEIYNNGDLHLEHYYPITGSFQDENNVSFYIRTGGLGGGSIEEVKGVKN